MKLFKLMAFALILFLGTNVEAQSVEEIISNYFCIMINAR